MLGRFADLAVDFVLHFVPVAQFVPQAVDLVQHHQAALVRAVLAHADVVVPDVDVGFGHAGVGGEDEQHRVRRGQHVERQFRFGAERIEARRVEDDQPLLQQRVRNIDNGVPPFRNFHQAVLGKTHPGLRFLLGDVKSHRLGLLARDVLDLGDVLQHLDHLVRRLGVERQHLPLLGEAAELGDGGAALAGLDRQQPQVRFAAVFIHDFGRAHGGAAGARRQDALPEVGEENGVDQLGFPARELGHEGDIEFVVAQGGQDVFEALINLGVAQLLSVQPGFEFGDGGGERLAPLAVGLEMLCEIPVLTGGLHLRNIDSLAGNSSLSA